MAVLLYGDSEPCTTVGLGACAEVLEFATGDYRAVVMLSRHHCVGCIRTDCDLRELPLWGDAVLDALPDDKRTASYGWLPLCHRTFVKRPAEYRTWT